MVFSSSLFLLTFLPLFFLGYFLLPYRWKNAWALLGSTAFYAWGAPLFVFVLFGSILIDYLAARRFESADNRKTLLWITMIANVGLLAYFKYANFFVDNVNTVLGSLGFHSLSWTKVVLPIGISFFTFQKISYVIDVYRGVRKPLSNYLDHALYVILFPQLIAGPIVRYNEIADQIRDRRHDINEDSRLLGIFRFALGLGKKVMIANILGAEADKMFAVNIHSLSSDQAWYGAICYTFQIYFDFSGYSDMAIGLGRMMGFRFPENFNNPYISKSITEFWRRWHMTLSNWMKDYLYIPLGGNRVSKNRVYLNLWIVFLISGLWHGAAWTFVVWGAYHGFFLVAERLFLNKLYKRLPGLIRVFITFVIVLFGWIIFRADSMDIAWAFIKRMLLFGGGGVGQPTGFMLAFSAAVLFSFFALIPGVEKWQERMLSDKLTFGRSILYTLFTIIVIGISVGMIASSSFNPFIYFRF